MSTDKKTEQVKDFDDDFDSESFGEEAGKNMQSQGGAPGDEFVRTRIPRGKEVLGVVETRLGGSRCRVRCFDGKTRICRIPGRLKRKLWVREEDVVLVEPWEFEGDSKGDIIHKYYPNQVQFLKKRGYLKQIDDINEF